jgi:CRP-like cAMP-binding protein
LPRGWVWKRLVKTDIRAFEHGLQLVWRRLSAYSPLGLAEPATAASLSNCSRLTLRDQDLGLVAGPQIVLSGWCCQQRRTSAGGRQIFAIILPGDVFSTVMDDGSLAPFQVTALTDVASLPVSRLVESDDAGAGAAIQHAVLLSARHSERRLFDHIERLGDRDAYDRIGHLFLELHDRLAVLELTEGVRFPFPIGQRRISEMLGLSEVHVNRTLQKMRTDGQLICGPGWYALPRRQELVGRTGYGQTRWPLT